MKKILLLMVFSSLAMHLRAEDFSYLGYFANADFHFWRVTVSFPESSLSQRGKPVARFSDEEAYGALFYNAKTEMFHIIIPGTPPQILATFSKQSLLKNRTFFKNITRFSSWGTESYVQENRKDENGSMTGFFHDSLPALPLGYYVVEINRPQCSIKTGLILAETTKDGTYWAIRGCPNAGGVGTLYAGIEGILGSNVVKGLSGTAEIARIPFSEQVHDFSSSSQNDDPRRRLKDRIEEMAKRILKAKSGAYYDIKYTELKESSYRTYLATGVIVIYD